ncbi:hypothetical protein DFA_11405 [Cavenderia fasciculata]|uniref:Uncharacterized protein n=1 Tax=Cavenderia fasciculata TaxID=261658 RepID=F4QCR2_CACFS|nr:uncharacterized protein DFA_11405 [Cavenderia fasciculata]EGG13644.1 hypothetical protein DFA_11405 [Cavenderia fasciculata]|eukprot:XP_004350348.1 hypothetical protein DFA_11405 [Cavenderia fasciculata]
MKMSKFQEYLSPHSNWSLEIHIYLSIYLNRTSRIRVIKDDRRPSSFIKYRCTQ